MLMINPDIYNINNLKENDKAEIGVINKIQQQVLSEVVVEDFIESKNVVGKTTQGLYRDTLIEFINFLKERTEYCKVDKIIEKIEGYSDEEFKSLYTAAKIKQK